MAEAQISITSIGSLAQTIITGAKSAAILGSTSRGLFLKLDDRWVIFLSDEPTRGPLTLNLNPARRTAFHIQPGQAVEIQQGGIVFPEASIHIPMPAAEVWMASPHPRPVLHPKDIAQRIQAAAREIIARRANAGLTAHLADLLQIPFPRPSLQPVVLNIHQVQQELASPSIPRVAFQMQKMLGLGSGLTPSGDDLISGFLLAGNRYRDALPLPFDLDQLNPVVIALAYQKTSLLSANLIECSTLGLADERLILALDGLLAGTLDTASCAELLLSWGNSSGCDAFLGMALATLSAGARA